MSKIKNIFLFIYKDLKSDVETVRYIFRQLRDGKPIIDPKKKADAIYTLKQVPKALFKESWYWLLALMFVFGAGYLVGLEKCEVECHNFIIENAEEIGDMADSVEVFPSISILPGNYSDENGEQQYESKYSIPNPTG